MEALDRAQHERALHIVSQCAQLGVAEHVVAESEKVRSTAAEEGAIERKTRARRPHAGNLGALERQKSSTISV